MQASIVVVGALAHCALPHSVCDLKATQIIVQCSLIQELRLYEFKLSHNTEQLTKNICYEKSKGALDSSSVILWFKKFCSGCNNLDDQAMSGRPKTADSGAAFQALEANPMSSTRRVSGEFDISLFSVVRPIHNLNKSTRCCLIVPCVIKILQNFWLTPIYILPNAC